MSADVRVRFCAFTDDSPDCVREEAIAADFATLKPKFIASKPLQGSIVISLGDTEARITDELWAAVAHLCFASLDALRNDRVHVYSYFTAHRYVVLIPVGEHLVHILGDEIPSLDVDKTRLRQELHACGQRYLAFLGALAAEDPDHRATLDLMRQIEANASSDARR